MIRAIHLASDGLSAGDYLTGPDECCQPKILCPTLQGGTLHDRHRLSFLVLSVLLQGRPSTCSQDGPAL